MPLVEAAPRLAEVGPVKGRLRELAAPAGYLILDDSYNASPESMEAAFAVATERPARRRLAVLGEMRELGATSAAEHDRVGRLAAATFDEVAVIEGGQAATLAAAARATVVPDVETASAWLRERASAGDLVLIKASRGVQLERLVEELTRQ